MATNPAPVLMYLVTDDWYFLSHRLAMAEAAQAAGYDVHVATRVHRSGEEIARRGFRLHALAWHRGSKNPLALVSVLRDVRQLYRKVRPDVVHHVALRPTLVGSLAATGLPIACLNAVAGLGFAFASPTLKARLARGILSVVLRYVLGRPHSAVLVQNPDDFAQMRAFGVPKDRLVLIPGSGVDVDHFQPMPEPQGAITVAYAGRLLADKGLHPLIEAQRLLAERGRPVRLLLAGDPDPGNPASISAAEITAWRSRPGVELLGHVADIRTVWRDAHIAVLPSRREGMPMSLLEAAACGRPMVATDVPGCREIVRHGETGLLVPPEDAAALAAALDRLAQDGALRASLGANARHHVEGTFSSRQVGRETVALYARLMRESGKEPPDSPSASQ